MIEYPNFQKEGMIHTPMLQQLNAPTSEQELKIIQDYLYKTTKDLVDNGKTPAFKNLIEIASSEVMILTSIHKIKANKGSKTPGVDNEVIDDILQKRYQEVVEIIQEAFKHYKPQEVRRVYIPKPGKTEKRPLGIPSIRDRIVQECVRATIEPILEAQFFKHSYGFRPMRDAKQAIERIVHIGNRMQTHWVVEGDIKGFFDNVNHSILIKQLWHMGIHDRRLLMIIKQMLEAGIMNEVKRNEIGTPQGGIISPLLANVYLHKLDQWIVREWEEKKLRTANSRPTQILRLHSTMKNRRGFYVRYADDWVLFTDSKERAEKWKYRISEYLQTNLKLTLSEEKTLITNINNKPMHFLGFSIKRLKHGKKGKYVTIVKPNDDKVKMKIKNLSKNIRKLKYVTNEEWLITDITNINSQIRGLINYYDSAPGISEVFRQYREPLKYTSYKALKKHGVKWIPTDQCYNLAMHYPNRTEQVPAVKVRGHWLGIISLSFATWHKSLQKNPDETPYTIEGRKIYMDRTQKTPALLRNQELMDKSYIDLVMSGTKSPIYNFEYFMNRFYAFNRDRGKCRVCGTILIPGDTHTHHQRRRLPINEINKVSNLVSTCNRCHTQIHTKEIIAEEISYLNTKSKEKLLRYRDILTEEDKSDTL